MKLKTIKAKINHTSRLGTLTFRGVPVSVPLAQKSKDFDPAKDDFFVPGDIIKLLDREVAKQWLRSHAETKPRRITANEARGIMSVIGVNASQFAPLIGVNKSKISKALNGPQKFELPSSKLAILILVEEIKNPGSILRSLDKMTPLTEELEPPVSNFASLG